MPSLWPKRSSKASLEADSPKLKRADSFASDSIPTAPPQSFPPSYPEPLPSVHALYEELTETWQYVVADPTTRQAVIIDPHLDNVPSATEISTIAADRVLTCIFQNGYVVDRILHTHEPTRHPSSAWYLRSQILQTTGRAPRVQIGKKLAAIQRVFKRKYSMNDGSQWRTDWEDDCHFADGETFSIGDMCAIVLHVNDGQLAFIVGRHIFAGSSQFDHEAIRSRGADIRDYQVYTAEDKPPERMAKLTTVFEKHDPNQSRLPGKKKLVIRYAAHIDDEQEPVELEA